MMERHSEVHSQACSSHGCKTVMAVLGVLFRHKRETISSCVSSISEKFSEAF